MSARTRALLLAALLALAAAPPAARADVVELPVDRPLEQGTVALALHAGRVEIKVSADESPRLRIDDLERAERTTGYVLLNDHGSWIEVEQPHGDASTAPPLAVALVVGPETAVSLRGDGISVEIEGGALADGTEGRPAPGPKRRTHRFEIDLDRSDVLLRGTGSVGVHGEDSTIRVEGGAGPLGLALTGGSATVEDRRGPIELGGADWSGTIRRLDGAVGGKLEGGQLSLADSVAALQLTAAGATIVLDGWRGSGQIRGELLRVELHRSGGGSDRLMIVGEEVEMFAEEYGGELTARLTGGAVTATDLGGRISLDLADGASADLARLGDTLTVQMRDGARLVAEEARRGVEITAADSRIDLDGVRDLRGKLRQGELVARGVTGRVRLTARDADVDLDLSESRSRSELVLRGATHGAVQMRQPCLVAPGGGERARERIDASGCDIAGSRRRSVSIGRGAPAVLGAELAPGADLEVYGAP